MYVQLHSGTPHDDYTSASPKNLLEQGKDEWMDPAHWRRRGSLVSNMSGASRAGSFTIHDHESNAVLHLGNIETQNQQTKTQKFKSKSKGQPLCIPARRFLCKFEKVKSEQPSRDVSLGLTASTLDLISNSKTAHVQARDRNSQKSSQFLDAQFKS